MDSMRKHGMLGPFGGVWTDYFMVDFVIKSIYNKLEHLENLIIAMNDEKMKRIRLPVPKEYGGERFL